MKTRNEMKKSMRKWILLVAVLVLAFASLSVNAATTYVKGSKTKTYQGSYYKIYYNGKQISNNNTSGIMINGNVMVPYYSTFVVNGPKLKATYKASKKKLTLTLGSNKVKSYVNKKYIYINSKKKKIPTAPLIANVNGTAYLMIPAKAICKGLGLNYTYVKSEKAVYITSKTTVNTQANTNTNTTATSSSTKTYTAKQLSALSTANFIKILGPIAQADYKKTGVLASVTLAQAINESGWCSTTLSQQGNNIFGMKIRLSENTWSGSTWDGKSYVTIYTKEEVKGKKITITAKFRKYPNINQSVADHSAYLRNAKNGSKNRYAGLTATNSYAKQLKILQSGGYCTWSSYVSELTSIIKKYNLTKYDVK